MGAFVREKKTYCGKEYLEVDIFPIADTQLKKRKSRKREKESAPAQKNLNDKRARRYLRQLMKTNFKQNDLHVTCTYKNKYLPKTIEEAEKEVTNYIRRIQYKLKKEGKKPLKYIIITEGVTKGEKPVRIHHHIIMSKVDRDMVESLWRKPRRKGEKQGDSIGFVNADRLQVGDDGMTRLANYLSKKPAGRKRWRSSQNLIPPTTSIADKKWTKRKLMDVAMAEDDNHLYWERMYPGWRMTSCESTWNDITGWSISIELRRITG